LINIKSILSQYNIWVNEVRLFVTAVLIGVLVNYMYSICSQHLENITEIDRMVQKEKHERERNNKADILEAFKIKEARKKILRNLQRDLAIEYKLLEKIGDGENSKSTAKKVNLNECDELYQTIHRQMTLKEKELEDEKIENAKEKVEQRRSLRSARISVRKEEDD